MEFDLYWILEKLWIFGLIAVYFYYQNKSNEHRISVLEKEFTRLDKDVYLKLLELSKDITYIRKEIDSKK